MPSSGLAHSNALPVWKSASLQQSCMDLRSTWRGLYSHTSLLVFSRERSVDLGMTLKCVRMKLVISTLRQLNHSVVRSCSHPVHLLFTDCLLRIERSPIEVSIHLRTKTLMEKTLREKENTLATSGSLGCVESVPLSCMVTTFVELECGRPQEQVGVLGLGGRGVSRF